MDGKLLKGLIIIAIIIALFSCWNRWQVEQSNRGVELIMDYNALSSLKDKEELEEESVISTLKEEGLTAIAIYNDTLKDLINTGDARLLTGNEIERTLDKTGEIAPVLASFPFDDNSAFIKVKKEKFIERLKEFLPVWKEKYKLDYRYGKEELVIFFPEWRAKYLHLSLGFDKELINKIKTAGLKVIPRINNNPLDNSQNWTVVADLSPKYIIFSGQEVTGFDRNPEKRKIARTAEVMLNNNAIFGMIEPYIAKQLGATTLARLMEYKILRVHSIQQAEMDSNSYKYEVENIVDRYLRGVKERNVRLLYLKPFLEEKKGKDPFTLTREYISLLAEKLRENGYQIGRAGVYLYFENSLLFLVFIGLGITAAGIILLEYLAGRKLQSYYPVFFIMLFIATGILSWTGREILLRKIFALATSIIFPSLAIISQLLEKKKVNLFNRFIKAAIISLMGSILLVASLAHLSFVLKVDQFAGVKLSFVLPIFIISLYYLRVSSTGINNQGWTYWQKRLNRFLNISIKVKHLLLLGILALVGLVYIGRTGNYPVLPVPEFEIYFRDWLEEVLYVRPRFKEFLIGHPFLLLALGLREKIKNYLLYYPVVVLASIGQINILNTFCHTHTPLFISLIRVFHGLWIGLGLGYLLYYFYGKCQASWQRRKA